MLMKLFCLASTSKGAYQRFRDESFLSKTPNNFRSESTLQPCFPGTALYFHSTDHRKKNTPSDPVGEKCTDDFRSIRSDAGANCSSWPGEKNRCESIVRFYASPAACRLGAHKLSALFTLPTDVLQIYDNAMFKYLKQAGGCSRCWEICILPPLNRYSVNIAFLPLHRKVRCNSIVFQAEIVEMFLIKLSPIKGARTLRRKILKHEGESELQSITNCCLWKKGFLFVAL